MFEINPECLSARDLIDIKRFQYPAFLETKCGGRQLANVHTFRQTWHMPLKQSIIYGAMQFEPSTVDVREISREFKLYDFTFFFDKKVGLYKEV